MKYLTLFIFVYPALMAQHIFATSLEVCGSSISPITLQTIIQAESSGNQFAIAVVGGTVRQPKTLADAITTANALQAAGRNFSVGLMQVNVKNFQKYGLTVATAFDACNNIRAGSAILASCFQAAKATDQYGDDQLALRAAMSCYYSGNFQRGFKLENTSRGKSSYVGRINQIVDAAYRVPAIKPSNKSNASDAVSADVESATKPTEAWDAFGDFS